MRRFARAADVEELLAAARDGRPGVLDDVEPHLHRRRDDGRTSAAALFAEIRALGYPGNCGTVRDHVRLLPPGSAPPAEPAPPKVRAVVGWVLRRPVHRR